MQASLLESVLPFVRFLQTVGRGRIEGLRVAGGLPVLDPPPTVIRRVDFGPGPDPLSPPRRVYPDDLALTVPMVQFLWACRQIGDGVIDVLYVRRSLPRQMHFQGRPVTTADAWMLLEWPKEEAVHASA